jgi:predicted O-linked N-acetylglucosamine transferase (SPINDLY family)
MGLPELITHTEEEFIEKASSYAKNPQKLVDLRKGLRARMQASPLMNGPEYAKDFGDAMRTMWREWCAKQKK